MIQIIFPDKINENVRMFSMLKMCKTETNVVLSKIITLKMHKNIAYEQHVIKKNRIHLQSASIASNFQLLKCSALQIKISIISWI